MVRNFQSFLPRDSILVPRWVVIVFIILAIAWLGFRIMASPTWIVQRLDSPDGERSARLLRTEYVRHHFKIQVREGRFWQTVFMSEPIEEDYRVDLGERLRWSEDSRRLYFMLRNEPVWGYDFDQRKRLRPASRPAP